MLANFHTHCTCCDGKDTPEDVVKAALEKEFSAIGFSSHGATPYSSYGMRDVDGYIDRILALKAQYANAISIYLGVEEDAFCPVDRNRFDYIIGSCHYLRVEGRYLPIDSNQDGFRACVDAFHGDAIRLAESYYAAFCQYIRSRKPDIIGHFDLITKFDEMDVPLFLDNDAYKAVAVRYAKEAAQSGCVFEVNTGAMARGLRTSPYPGEEILHALKTCDAKLILSSDSHQADTLDFAFAETKRYLYGIGFRSLYTLRADGFEKYTI